MSKEMNSTKKRTKAKKSKPAPPKVSYYKKPEGLSLDKWQTALRKQYAEKQVFEVENIEGREVFSDYLVHNSESKNSYKVAIRGAEPEWNFCSCMDFKTNMLRTCKHIEFVLLQINKTARTRKILKAGYYPHYTSIYLDYGTERKVKIRIGSEKESEFKNLAKIYFDDENTLKSDAYTSVDVLLKKAHSLHPDFRCYPDALEYIIDHREASKRNIVVSKAIKKEDFFKEIIKADLFPYQKEGVEFALRKGRSLIADDMGLGKTIQAIAAAEGMKSLYGISKVLIICPTSLKYQWKSEIQKFTDSKVTVIEGNMHNRERQYEDDSFYNICSYNVVGRDIKAINKNNFDLVILDEAQRIKNWKTKTAANVKRVESKYCIVLTGTPLENKIEELYSVVQVVNPLLLGALFRFVSEHQITEEETGKVIGYKGLNKITEILKDVLIRRHKRDVLKQLPERMDKNLFVPMTAMQIAYYADAYDVVCRLVNKWRKFGYLDEQDRQRLLINLNLMRMACNSTFIIDQKTRHDTKIDELMNILDEVFESGDEKVVIFSQWERMTRIVGQELDQRNIRFENLHGGIASKDREQLFENFRNDPESRVFLSTDAGGVGLNLQSASLLINLDLPWNPAVLEQRIGRIHRMGQKRKVQIINLIAQGTIEHEMLDKLKFKSSVAAGILDNGESSVFLGETKFTELMKQVEDMTTNTISPTTPSDTDVEQEAPEAGRNEKQQKEEDAKPTVQKQLELFDDDNGAYEESSEETSPEKEKSETHDLLESGGNFFGKLLHTLSDKNKTEELLNTLVKKDEKTGNTYLQIPVENQKVVENGLKMLGQLLGGFK